MLDENTQRIHVLWKDPEILSMDFLVMHRYSIDEITWIDGWPVPIAQTGD